MDRYSSEQQRYASGVYPLRPFRLLTIRVSHYNEKARWVLDRFEVPYDERPFMPVLHVLPVLKATRGIGESDLVSSFVSTPVLQTDTGTMVHDSRDVVYYINCRFAATPESSLYPNSAVRELDLQFHNKIGPLTRRIAYYYSFGNDRVNKRITEANVGDTQARIFSLLYPLIKRKIIRDYQINKDNVARDEEKLFRILDAVAERLLSPAAAAAAKAEHEQRGTKTTISYDDEERSRDINLQSALGSDESTGPSADGAAEPSVDNGASCSTGSSNMTLYDDNEQSRHLVDDDDEAVAAMIRRRRTTRVPKRGIYICGDRFTAADLTFASLLAPVLLVQPEEGYGARMPSLNEVPYSYRRLVERVREHPAGAFAMRMFAEERGIRVLPCSIGTVSLPSAKL